MSLPQQSLDLTTYPTTSLQQLGLFIVIFFPVLSSLIVSLRIYGRVTTKNFGWDDTFIIAAVVRLCIFAVRFRVSTISVLSTAPGMLK